MYHKPLTEALKKYIVNQRQCYSEKIFFNTHYFKQKNYLKQKKRFSTEINVN